jgi:hypothetical protein
MKKLILTATIIFSMSIILRAQNFFEPGKHYAYDISSEDGPLHYDIVYDTNGNASVNI